MALASMFVCLFPLFMGIAYALRPSEQRLTLVRTLSLATVFSSICGLALGLINELRFVSRVGIATFNPQVAAGLAESFMTLFFGFGCLTVTWLCVTVGMWRRP
jgi:hypothetical protein